MFVGSAFFVTAAVASRVLAFAISITITVSVILFLLLLFLTKNVVNLLSGHLVKAEITEAVLQPFEILHVCKIGVFPVREEVVVTAVAHFSYKTGVDVVVPSLIE